MKIGYFADGVWSHLALEKLIKNNSFEICFIVPRYDSQDPILKKISEKLSIDFLPIKNVNHSESIDILAQYEVDLFISMSFDQILKDEIINMEPLGFINCHAGNLPFYRGRNILNWVLINDEREFGVTVHYVDIGIDTGDIIEQVVEPITDTDDYSTLLDRATILCSDLLFKAVSKIYTNSVSRVKQSEKHPVGLYCGRRRDGDEWIDWSWTSRKIFNFIRGVSKPGPCAKTIYNSCQVIIERSSMIKNAPNYIDTPGAIVGREGKNLIVKTGDSTIKLEIFYTINNSEPKCDKFTIGSRLGFDNINLIMILLSKVSKLEEKVK